MTVQPLLRRHVTEAMIPKVFASVYLVLLVCYFVLDIDRAPLASSPSEASSVPQTLLFREWGSIPRGSRIEHTLERRNLYLRGGLAAPQQKSNSVEETRETNRYSDKYEQDPLAIIPKPSTDNDAIDEIAKRLKEELNLGPEADRLIAENRTEELTDLIRGRRKMVDQGLEKDTSVGYANASETFVLTQVGRKQREMVTKQMAEVYGETLKQRPNSFKAINLSGKSIGREASKVFAGYLEKCVHITEVDISDCIAGREEGDAHDGLENLSNALGRFAEIRMINVNNNALGDKGINRLRYLLENKKYLTDLRLGNIGGQVAAMKIVKEIILNTTKPTLLKHLELHRNLLTTDGAVEAAALIRHSPMLNHLSFRQSRVTSDGAEAIFKAILEAGVQHLQVLDIRNNNMGISKYPSVTESFAAVLAQQKGLVELRMGGSGLFVGPSLKRIMHVLLDHSKNSLEVLDLTSCRIKEDSVESVSKMIEPFTNVRELNLDGNKIKSEGIKTLVSLLEQGYFPNLEVLDLKDNEIGSIGGLAIARAVVERNLKVRNGGGEAKSKMKTIKRLELDQNTINEWVLSEIGDLFAKAKLPSTILGELDLNDAEFDEDEKDKIEEEKKKLFELVEKHNLHKDQREATPSEDDILQILGKAIKETQVDFYDEHSKGAIGDEEEGRKLQAVRDSKHASGKS